MREEEFPGEAKEKAAQRVLRGRLEARIAGERMGIAIYEILLERLQSANPASLPMEALRSFRSKKQAHLSLLQRARVLLTNETQFVQVFQRTPLVSVGLLELVENSHSHIASVLEAVLIVALTDSIAWELLIPLAEQAGMAWLAWEFREALREEKEQSRVLREWLESLSSKDAQGSAQKSAG